MANTKGCKWNIALVGLAARPGTLFVLVRSTELGAAPFTCHRNTFTVETFVANICRGYAEFIERLALKT